MKLCGRAGIPAIRRLVPPFVALLCAFALAVSLAACGAGKRAETVLDIRRLADALIDGIAFDDQMDEASDQAFYALYAVDPSDESVMDFALRTGAGATA